MTKNKIFLWVQTALCVLIAILLAVAAVRIFLDGSAYQAAGHPSEWIYTREKAAAALMPILPLFLLSFAMTVYGLVKGIEDEEADKPVQDVERTRDLVCARVAQPSEEMAKERALQKKLQLGGWIGFAVCMIPILLYITNGAHRLHGRLCRAVDGHRARMPGRRHSPSGQEHSARSGRSHRTHERGRCSESRRSSER